MLSFTRFHFAVLVVFSLSLSAWGDISNRNFLPFGEVESFLGNTGTGGGIDSTSAVYYNPAALTGLDASRLSVSGSSYYQYSLSYDSSLKQDNSTLPYHVSSMQTVPGTVISTFHSAQSTWAYFVLVPESVKLENETLWNLSTGKYSSLTDYTGGDLWVGGSYAFHLSPDWSFGVSLFGIRHETTRLISQFVADSTGKNAEFEQLYLQGNVYALSLEVGLLYQLTPDASVGLRIQSPLLDLLGSGSGYISLNTVTGGTLGENDSQSDNLDMRYQLPLDFTLGLSYAPFSHWRFLADVSLQTPLTYSTVPSSTQYNTRLQVVTTLRYNLGARYEFSRRFCVLGGVFVDPSAGTNFSGTGQSASGGTFYGATLGVNYVSDRVKTGLGGFFEEADGNYSDAVVTSALKVRLYGALVTVGYVL